MIRLYGSRIRFFFFFFLPVNTFLSSFISPGIINTLINYIYQYLCKKLNLLVKYLYNENIKSKLIKEIKVYRDNKLQVRPKPFFQLFFRCYSKVLKRHVNTPRARLVEIFALWQQKPTDLEIRTREKQKNTQKVQYVKFTNIKMILFKDVDVVDVFLMQPTSNQIFILYLSIHKKLVIHVNTSRVNRK